MDWILPTVSGENEDRDVKSKTATASGTSVSYDFGGSDFCRPSWALGTSDRTREQIRSAAVRAIKPKPATGVKYDANDIYIGDFLFRNSAT